MSILHHTAPSVQSIPAGLVPPELVEVLDPYGAEFSHYPDECPELPESDYPELDPEDARWWAEKTGGGWVVGESSPFELELFTVSALDYFLDALMPDPELPQYPIL